MIVLLELHFCPNQKNALAKFIGTNGELTITSDITNRVSSGVLVVDAQKDGYSAYSIKKFKITVDDSGTISATEVTG